MLYITLRHGAPKQKALPGRQGFAGRAATGLEHRVAVFEMAEDLDARLVVERRCVVEDVA